MAAEPVAPTAVADAGVPTAAERRAGPGIGPYKLAARRLRRDYAALVAGAIFLAICLMCLLAPVYAKQIAPTTPNANHVTDVVRVGGKNVNVVSPEGIPTGPTWHGRFFLGADQNGRDVAVRLLYGGRNSLEIGLVAALVTMVLATLLGTMAGYFRGFTDGVISRYMDLMWAFPAILLAIALGTSLALGGLHIGPLKLQGNSLLI